MDKYVALPHVMPHFMLHFILHFIPILYSPPHFPHFPISPPPVVSLRLSSFLPPPECFNATQVPGPVRGHVSFLQLVAKSNCMIASRPANHCEVFSF